MYLGKGITVSAVSDFMHSLLINLKKGNKVAVILLDLSEAFDSVSQVLFVEKSV